MRILVTLSVPDDRVDDRFPGYLKFYLDKTKTLGCTVESVYEIEKLSD